MIIKSPTGFYRPILPTGDDVGNITFTISTQPPPRSDQSFIQLPRSEEARQASDRTFTKNQKREFLGQLLFDLTTAGPSATAAGVPQFEIGEIIPFADNENESIDPYVFRGVLLRQNTKVPDFESAGLTIEDYNELVQASQNKLEVLTSSLSSKGSQLATNTTKINDNQANINNSKAILDNIILVLGEDSSQAMKVKNNLEKLEEEKQLLVAQREMLQTEIDQLNIEIQLVRESVR